jgi:ABC-type lipoprotein export system ATPase subunit
VREITKSLPPGRERIDILRDISFQMDSGEFISIVGPSGSGKSNLLGIIAGLDNPTSGKVFIDGVDITTMSEGKLAEVRKLFPGSIETCSVFQCAILQGFHVGYRHSHSFSSMTNGKIEQKTTG